MFMFTLGSPLGLLALLFLQKISKATGKTVIRIRATTGSVPAVTYHKIFVLVKQCKYMA